MTKDEFLTTMLYFIQDMHSVGYYRRIEMEDKNNRSAFEAHANVKTAAYESFTMMLNAFKVEYNEEDIQEIFKHL